jgi:Resolvase, N terminal domain
MERVKGERDLDYVIVHKVDRLARNRYVDATITYALHRAGVELISVTENIDDTPFGRFMHAISAANAEFYSANLAAEAKKGLIQKAKAGGTPTRAPIGYLNVRKLIDGREVRTVGSIRTGPRTCAGPSPPTARTPTRSTRSRPRRRARTRHAPDAEPASEADLVLAARLPAPEPLLRRHRPLRGGRVRGPPRAVDRPPNVRPRRGRARRPQPRRREGPKAPPLPQGLALLRALRVADEPDPRQGQRRHLPLLLLHRPHEGHRLAPSPTCRSSSSSVR